MLHHFILLSFKVLEVAFFTGLAGCTLVILVSWVSILSSGLSRKPGD
jgi:hypothetical protein